jgi:hypothetical protein
MTTSFFKMEIVKFQNPIGIFKVEILFANSKQIKPIFLVMLVPLFKHIGVPMARSL